MAKARVNALAFAIMVRALYDGPKTLHQLSEITGLHLWTVRHYVKAMQRQEVAHITGWTKDSMGRDTTAHYALGMGVDMPREAKTGAQKQKALRARRRAAVEAVNQT
jgi:predicted ArsR family transcriptional regulator